RVMTRPSTRWSRGAARDRRTPSCATSRSPRPSRSGPAGSRSGTDPATRSALGNLSPMLTPGAPAIDGATHLHSGKVRDLYALPDGHLLMVASDRISAFDYVLETPIPDKGRILTRMSLWWFERLADLVPNHVVSTDVPDDLVGRAVV